MDSGTMVSVKCYKIENTTRLILVPLISISGIDAKDLQLKGLTMKLALSERSSLEEKTLRI